MVPANWPIVAADDPGLRGSTPGVCYFCDQPIGQQHGTKCIIPNQKVRVRYIFDVVKDVPACWDEGNIEFHFNESSWCASNTIQELVGLEKQFDEIGSCLCNSFKAEVIGITDPAPFITKHQGLHPNPDIAEQIRQH